MDSNADSVSISWQWFWFRLENPLWNRSFELVVFVYKAVEFSYSNYVYEALSSREPHCAQCWRIEACDVVSCSHCTNILYPNYCENLWSGFTVYYMLLAQCRYINRIAVKVIWIMLWSKLVAINNPNSYNWHTYICIDITYISYI